MKPYPAYKPSGVPWLGEVPAHWEINLVKRGFEVVLGKMLQTEQRSEDEQFARYLRSANVQWGKVDTCDIQQMWFSPHELKQLNLEYGDLVVCEGGDAGRGAIWGGELEDCYFQNSVNRIRSSWQNSTRYLLYWLWSIKQAGFIEVICSKATIAHLTKEKLQALPMLYPSLDEQQAIADYLDTETARIDTLIAEKVRLTETLREFSRSTFVGEFVAQASGGINAHPRIEWLPAIPSDWTCCKVKHIVESFDQGVSPQCEARPPEGDEWGVLKVGCVNTGLFDPQESKALPPDLPTFDEITLREGDVMVSRANTRNLVGRCAAADKAYPRLMLSDKLYRLRIDRKRCTPAFLVDLLALPLIRQRIEERATGASASMLNIDRRTILELDIVLPPLDVQLAIVQRIQGERQGISKLVEHVASEIDLLCELRAATITDAVTGKIQVSQ